MENKNNTWLLHLGAVKIPEEWYRDRSSTNPKSINQFSIRGNEHNSVVGKMRRAIYILKKRYRINSGLDTYNILLEKKLIPYVTESKLMGFLRFKHYYYEVMKDPRIKTGAKKNKNYIKENYLTKAVEQIAIEIGKSRDYVRSTISRIRRERR